MEMYLYDLGLGQMFDYLNIRSLKSLLKYSFSQY